MFSTGTSINETEKKECLLVHASRHTHQTIKFFAIFKLNNKWNYVIILKYFFMLYFFNIILKYASLSGIWWYHVSDNLRWINEPESYKQRIIITVLLNYLL